MPSAAGCRNPALLEQILKQYAEGLALENTAVRVVTRGLTLVGIGIRPVLDHFIFRTLRPEEKANEFLEMGYERNPASGVLEHKGHGVEIFRKDHAPAILIEHPRKKAGMDWVTRFGDNKPYAMALRVDNIDEAAFHMEKQSVGFIRPPAGKHGETLREIAALPEMKDGKNAHYLILVERHEGDQRFYPPDFWIHP
ncbi:MAG: hypothetical protein WC530_06455 [Candidatus Omnitrophota bacterium]